MSVTEVTSEERRRILLTRVRDERVYHERMVGELTEASRRLETFIRDLQAKQRRLAKVPPARPPGDTPGAQPQSSSTTSLLRLTTPVAKPKPS